MTQAQVVNIDLGAPIVDEPVDDGVYRAQLVEVRAVPNRFEEGKQQLQFRWEIVDGDEKGKQLTSWANLVPLTPKAKLRTIAEALYGRPLRPDESLSTYALVGREARLHVSLTYKPDSTAVSKVTAYSPAKRVKPVYVADDDAI